MFFNPNDLWTVIVFVLIALVVIWAIYGLIFWKMIEERMVEIPAIDGQIKLTDAVIPNPRFPIVDLTEIEKVEAAQSEDLEDNDLYIQIIVPVLRVRAESNTTSTIVRKFYKGMVLKVEEKIEMGEELWYKIDQDKSGLRYPERVNSEWYVAGKYNGEWLTKKVKEGEQITVFPETQSEDKWIKVTVSKQTLEAFEDEKLVFKTLVSTGKMLKDYPTPKGNFRILEKELSDYMQGPLPGDDEYFDLPGIPFVMKFTDQGHALHGTYWHSDFGNPRSHGCINLSIEDSEWLFQWAEIGTLVIVE